VPNFDLQLYVFFLKKISGSTA